MSNLALNNNSSQVKNDISYNNNIPKANITLNLALALNSTNKKLNNNIIQKNNVEIENNSNNININANNGNFGILPNNNCSNIAAKSKINLENAPKFKLNFENLKNDEDNDSEPENYEEEDEDKKMISNIFLKHSFNQKKINERINNNNNNINGGAKTHRAINKNKMGITKNFFVSNNKISKNKIKSNCMSSRYIYGKSPILNEMRIKGNLTERITNQNQNNGKHFISKKSGPKTQREIMAKHNKTSIKEFSSINSNNKNNFAYTKEKIKKDNLISKNKNEFGKKSNSKIAGKIGNINNHVNMIYNQRPNSSRVYSNKDSKINNLIKGNNIINKIFSDNKRYFGFSQHPININMSSASTLSSSNKPISAKINITQGKSMGPFIKAVKPKKGY